MIVSWDAPGKVILVGEAPSRTSSGAPLEGRTGRRLEALLGLEAGRLAMEFAAVNLLRSWPGPAGAKGSRFPIAEARGAAEELLLGWPGRDLVLLGGRVASAMCLRNLARGPLEWWGIGIDGGRIAVLPHPSGVNRWWNDPANVEAARRFLAACALSARGVTCGEPEDRAR